MTKESGGDIVLGPETDPNDKDSSQLSEMPDTENIQIQPNNKQLQNSKVLHLHDDIICRTFNFSIAVHN